MSEFQLCACGSAPGYPHRKDCPRPLYNPTDSQFEQWEKEWLAKTEQLNMKTQHTPTPWYVIPDFAWQGRHPLHDARFIATSKDVEITERGEDSNPPRTWNFANREDSIICTMPDAENQKANAEFIVKACNCHDALLEACKAALHISHIDQDSLPLALKALAEIRGELQAAIAKAQE